MTTAIEWVQNPDGTRGVTCNSKTGCLNHTPEGLCLGGLFPCYAYRLAHGRLRDRYSLSPSSGWKINYDPSKTGYSEACIDPFYPKWWPERLRDIPKDWRTLAGMQHVKPRGIFLDDMSDWMGDYWPEEWTQQELQVMRDCPQHRFYTLTKQPQNLRKWSPFPENCWVGVTATNTVGFANALEWLYKVEATTKFVSIEPLLDWDAGLYQGIKYSLSDRQPNWLIIGACTGTEEEMEKLQNKYQSLSVMSYGSRGTAQPPIEWVQEIIEAADSAGVKVFLKDNLHPIFSQYDMYMPSWSFKDGELRQEMPK